MEFEKNQRTFPLSFWFFVSTFVKTVSSLKKIKPGTRGSFDSKSIQKTGTRRFCDSEI
jgi:predicted AlkP superfamily phosphohydrolase/phosphomutase